MCIYIYNICFLSVHVGTVHSRGVAKWILNCIFIYNHVCLCIYIYIYVGMYTYIHKYNYIHIWYDIWHSMTWYDTKGSSPIKWMTRWYIPSPLNSPCSTVSNMWFHPLYTKPGLLFKMNGELDKSMHCLGLLLDDLGT